MADYFFLTIPCNLLGGLVPNHDIPRVIQDVQPDVDMLNQADLILAKSNKLCFCLPQVSYVRYHDEDSSLAPQGYPGANDFHIDLTAIRLDQGLAIRSQDRLSGKMLFVLLERLRQKV